MSLTATQLKERQQGIGGSDVAALLGLSNWTTPLQLYMRKRGELAEDDINEAMRWGEILEGIILEEYQNLTGLKVSKPKHTIKKAGHEFMLANLDGLIEYVENGKRYCKIVEIKTANQYDVGNWGEPYTDQIPDYYLTQCHHYMTVLDAQECDVAVLIGGNDFRVYNIKRDHELSQMLIEREGQFWEMVQKGIIPDIVTTTDWKIQYLNKLTENSIVASDEDLQLVKELYRTNKEIKALELKKDEINGKILCKLKNNKFITYAGNKLGSIITKNVTSWDTKLLETNPDLVAKYKNKVTNSAYFQLAKTKNIDSILGVI